MERQIDWFIKLSFISLVSLKRKYLKRIFFETVVALDQNFNFCDITGMWYSDSLKLSKIVPYFIVPNSLKVITHKKWLKTDEKYNKLLLNHGIFEFLLDALLATSGLFFSIFSIFNADLANVSLLFFYPVTTSSTGPSSLAAKDAYT